jgi:hypothetical protein
VDCQWIMSSETTLFLASSARGFPILSLFMNKSRDWISSRENILPLF